MSEIEEVWNHIIKSLVGDPGHVKLTVNESALTTLITISVAEEDVGRILGRSGNTFHLLTKIAAAQSGVADRRILIELNTNQGVQG